MNRIVFVLIALTALIVGCASTPMKVLTPPPDYTASCKELGEAEGSSSGVLLFDLIPLGINERFVNASQQAIASLGGTHLVDPSVKDYWYYLYIGIYHVTKVKGKVIKCP